MHWVWRGRARSWGENYDVIALIGDGALTGGLAYEGLSDAGQSGEPMVIVLNDNGMSINKNVGGMATLLSKQRVKPGYLHFKRFYRSTVGKAPGLYRILHHIKEHVKDLVLPNNMFDDMGFYYIGPVDGHDEPQLEKNAALGARPASAGAAARGDAKGKGHLVYRASAGKNTTASARSTL